MIDSSIEKISKVVFSIIGKGDKAKLSQLLCYAGLARGSVADILKALRLQQSMGLPVDLSDITKKILVSKEVKEFYPVSSLALNKQSIEYEVPFEKLYFLKDDWESDINAKLASATNGEYVCCYIPTHGLLLIGSGEGRLFGKLYKQNSSATISKIFYIEGCFYALEKNMLYPIDMETLFLQEEKKQEIQLKYSFITSNGEYLLTYSTKSQEEEKTEAELSYFSVSDLSNPVQVINFEHKNLEINDIAICGNLLVLYGNSKYQIIDISLNMVTKKEETTMFSRASLCINPTKKDFFLISADESTGFSIIKMKTIILATKKCPYIEQKLSELSKELNVDLVNKQEMNNNEISQLLGFHTSPVSDEPCPKYTRSESLLLLLASRAHSAEVILDRADTTFPEITMTMLKMPLAIHLNTETLTALIEFIEDCCKDYKTIPAVDVKLYALFELLHIHLQGFAKCNISLANVLDKDYLSRLSDLCKNTIPKLLENEEFAGKITEGLRKEFKESCNDFLSFSLSDSKAQTTIEIVEKINEVLNYRSGKTPSVENTFSWFSQPRNVEMLAYSILKIEKDALNLLHIYFKLEAAYIQIKLKNIHKKTNSSLIEEVLLRLYNPMSKVIDKVSTLISSQQEERKETIQNILGPLFDPFKLIMLSIKETYSEYKEILLKNQGELLKKKEFGLEYSKYWLRVENLLSTECLLFNFLSVLITIPIGMQCIPERSLKLGNLLMKFSAELKLVVGDLALEKKVDPDTSKPLFPLYELDEYFVNEKEMDINSVFLEKEFEFIGASAVHIQTMTPIDIVSSENSEITVTDSKKNRAVSTLSAKEPNIDKLFSFNKVKLTAKVEGISLQQLKAYKGFNLKIRPKFLYGQKTLKKMLRSLLWTACFIAKSSLIILEVEEKTKGNTQLVQTILDSQLLSGGLPSSAFLTLFSKNFNTRYNAIKEVLQFDDTLDAPLDEKELEDLKNIMNEKSEVTDKIWETLKNEMKKKQPFMVCKDKCIEKIILYTFCVLVKITDSLVDWKTACLSDKFPNSSTDKLAKLWISANRMSLWVSEKKKAFSGDDNEYKKFMDELLESVETKFNLLVSFRSLKSSDKEGISKKRSITFVNTDTDSSRRASVVEFFKSRLSKWKDIQKAVSHTESDQLSLTAAAILFLQSDISSSQLITHIENYYLKAIVLFGTMSLCEIACNNVFSKQIRADILAWVASIFKAGRMGSWHYSQQTSACGAGFQSFIRSVFFGIIKHVLEYVTTSKTQKELPILLDAIKWNYSARDHSYIWESKLLPSLCTEKGYVGTLWGKPLMMDHKNPDLLLDTFEFIVMKILNRALKKEEKKQEESVEDFQRIKKSFSVLDESSTLKILETISKIIFQQLEKAVTSYESAKGGKKELISEYCEYATKSAKEKEEEKYKDQEKLLNDFQELQKESYSSNFCTRILRLLYRILVAIQNDFALRAKYSVLLEDSMLITLFKMLQSGSLQHKFLVLQIITLLSQISIESMENAASEFISSNPIRMFTRSSFIDLMLEYAVKNRESLWRNKKTDNRSNYIMSKCCINAIRSLMNNVPEFHDTLFGVIKIMMNGTEAEIMALPSECRSRVFIEVLLSVAGGEFEGLHKGCLGFSKGTKYSLIAFCNSKITPRIFEQQFTPKMHDEILIHLAEEENSIGDSSASSIPVSQLCPHSESLDVSSLFNMELMKFPEPSDNPLQETLNLKLIKLVLKMLKRENAQENIKSTSETINMLLDQAIKTPSNSSSKSLIITEIAIEEMRRMACDSENSTLDCTNRLYPEVKLQEKQLLFNYRNCFAVIPINAYSSNLSKILNDKYEFIWFKPELTKSQIEGKFIFTPAEHIKNELLVDQIIISDLDIKSIADPNAKYISVSKPFFESISSRIEQLISLEEHARNSGIDALIAEYMKIPLPKKFDTTNPAIIVKNLMSHKSESSDNSEEKKAASIQEAPKKKNALIQLLDSSTKNYIFSSNNDLSLQSQKETWSKNFTSSYGSVFSSDSPSPSAYISKLADLRIFYMRQILLTLLSKKTVMEDLPLDTKKKIFDLLILLSCEADYMHYGFKSKWYSDKVNQLLSIFISLPESLDIFTNWIKEKAMTSANTKEDKGFSLFSSSENDLTKTISLRFVFIFINIMIENESRRLFMYKEIDTIITSLISLYASIKQIQEVYMCIRTVKEIIGGALAQIKDLPPEVITRLLMNKGLVALSKFLPDQQDLTSIIYRNTWEVIQKLNSIQRIGVSLHGELVQFKCTNNDVDSYVRNHIMKSFPDFKEFLTYFWYKLYQSDAKSKGEQKLETPKPFYDTIYNLKLENAMTESFDISVRKDSQKQVAFTVDKSTKSFLELASEEKTNINANFNRIYIRFPFEGTPIYGIGSNEGGRLGLKEIANADKFTFIPEFSREKILGIYSNGSHTLVACKGSLLYCSGKGKGKIGRGDSNTFKLEKSGATNVVAINMKASIYYNELDNKFHCFGANPERMMLSSEDQINNYTFSAKGKPIQVSISKTHTLIVNDEGQLHAIPLENKELFGSWIDGSDSEQHQIVIHKNVEKVLAAQAINGGSVVLCKFKDQPLKQLMSFGLEKEPGCGQGDKVNQEKYMRLEYPEDVEFVSLTGCENMCAATTSKGELYTWGKAPNGALAQFTEEGEMMKELSKPTKVEALAEYKVIQVSCGIYHILVLVEDKEKKVKIFAFGDNSCNQLGCDNKEIYKNEISSINGKIPQLVCAGNKCSFIVCEMPDNSISHGENCCIHNTPIKDTIYYCPTPSGELKCYSSACLKDLPTICYCTQYPIKEISKKTWPQIAIPAEELKEPLILNCTLCNEQIKGRYYKSAVKESKNILCESCFNKTPTTFDPVIYHCIATINISCETLPQLTLSDYYAISTDSVQLQIKPDYQLKFPASYIDASVKPSLEEFLAESQKFTIEHDIDILDLINEYLIDKNKEVTSISIAEEISIAFRKKNKLRFFSEAELARRTKILLELNRMLLLAVNYIDFTSKSKSSDDLYVYYMKVKEYLASTIKYKIVKTAMKKLPQSSEMPTIQLERRKAFKLKELKQVDYDGKICLFSQLWRNLKGKVDCFRKKSKGEECPFRVCFKAEGGVDAGGLFRETMDQISEELLSHSLPLFIPTQNHKTNFGFDRDKWTLNPSAKQSLYLEMYEFLGSLLGMCFRMNHLLSLSLPSFFWKQLLGDPVDSTDLAGIDTYSVQCLDGIVNCEQKGINKSTFAEILDMNFTTILSDGSEVEVKNKGKMEKVSYENRKEYAELVEKARLEEGQLQIKAIRNGFMKIVPFSILKLFSWHDVEIKICGKPTYTADALKKITIYEDCKETDSFVQFFWQVLEEFSDEDRSQYLHFVWGRSRLPNDLENTKHSNQCISWHKF